MPKKISVALSMFLMCTLIICGCGEKGKTSSVGKKNTKDAVSDTSSSNIEDTSSIDSSSEDTLGDIDFDDMDFDDMDFYDDSFEETIDIAGPDIIPTGNTSILMNPQTGGADAEAATLRNTILNAADKKLSSGGTTYYVSEKYGNDDNPGTKEKPWKTASAVSYNNYKINYGDTVLFERGGLYRLKESIPVKSGVSYGAYGAGNKPAIYASPKNYANELVWTPSHKRYVWSCDIASYIDIGNIVFNNGENSGVKRSKLANLTKNFDFYSDELNGKCYLYIKDGNPGNVFKDIELCPKVYPFLGRGTVTNVNIDNFCIKYSGAHGISFSGKTSDVTVTNCEIGWIGGSYINSGGGRYGNGIEFYENVSNIVCSNNWVYQCYDAGISPQGENGAIVNVTLDNNLVEYCTWSIEFWHPGMDRLYFTNNILRFAGMGWGNQRPCVDYDSHFHNWDNFYPNLTDLRITGNILDCSAIYLVYWQQNSKVQPGVTISNNTYYQKAPCRGIAAWRGSYIAATDQKTFETAVAAFDSSPKKVQWLG